MTSELLNKVRAGNYRILHDRVFRSETELVRQGMAHQLLLKDCAFADPWPFPFIGAHAGRVAPAIVEQGNRSHAPLRLFEREHIS